MAKSNKVDFAAVAKKQAELQKQLDVIMAARKEIEDAVTEALGGFLSEISEAVAEIVPPAPDTRILLSWDEKGTVQPTLFRGKAKYASAGGTRARVAIDGSFEVFGPKGSLGRYGSFSTAGKAVQNDRGKNPSVNGLVFWKRSDGTPASAHTSSPAGTYICAAEGYRLVVTA